MSGIKICGTGHCAGDQVITNDDLANRVQTSDEWITSRTGIVTRYICNNKTHTDLCLEAAEQAMLRANIAPHEIGAVIVATMTADTLMPSAACMMQKLLNLPQDIICFDLNAACTGFVSAMHTMECLLQNATRKYGLVIGADALSRVLDWDDRNTCVLFGDGAGAVVVEYQKQCESIHAVLGARGEQNLLHLPGAGAQAQYISMEGTKVFKFAVEAVPQCMEQVLEKAKKSMDEVDFFVFHQANARIIDFAVRRYHIPQEKYYKNIAQYGNTSAASIPIVLSELQENGIVKSGNRVMIVAFGGGLTWGGALIEFA